MPPQYVKAYVRRNKTDAADAEAICEAARRPSMRFVPVKTADQQSALMMHRARDLLIRQRTMLHNALRGHLAEFGVIAAQGPLKVIAGQIDELATPIAALEVPVLAWHQGNAGSQRLATVPGIRPVIATAIAATVPGAGVFGSGRAFAAWLGLVPRQNSTGGKARLGGISKRGDSYLRRLLVNGAHAALLRSKTATADPWVSSLRDRKPRLVVAVALANKTARIAWAIMSSEGTYRRGAATA